MKPSAVSKLLSILLLLAQPLFAAPSPPACAVKDHPAVVTWRNVVSPAPAGAVPALSVEIETLKSAVDFVVSFRASGAFSLSDDTAAILPSGAPGARQTLAVPWLVNPGLSEGSLTLTLRARDGAGNVLRTMSMELNGIFADGRLYYGAASILELQQTYIADLEAGGTISPAEGLRRRRALATRRDQITLPAVAGARENQKPTGPLSITGTVRWKDHKGTNGTDKFFPVIGMKLVAADKANPTVPLANAVTDRQGKYTMAIAKDVIDATADAFVLVLTAETVSSGFNVKTPGAAGTNYIFTREIAGITDQTSITANAGMFNVDFDKISDADAGIMEANRVWAVYSCLFLLNQFEDASGQLSGAPTYPCNYPHVGAASTFGGGQMNVLSADYSDFDVIYHEYGHFIQERFSLTSVPATPAGVAHGFADELITKYDKPKGINMAWSEGMATALGLAIQYQAKYGLTLAPRFGNASYDESEDLGFALNIESEDTYKNFSEGNEATVARVLYDLFDDTLSGEGFDRVAWGFETLMSNLKNGTPKNLDALWDKLTTNLLTPAGTDPNLTFVHRTVLDQYGPLFAKDNVAPDPISPKNKAELDAFTGANVTFKWKQNINNVKTGMKFRVLILKTNGSVVKSSPEVAGVAGAEQMTDVPKTLIEEARTAAGPNEPLFWTVAGSDPTASAPTGVYVGPPLPLDATGRILFVIDDTGSMGNEIGAVRDGLLQFLQRFDASSTATSFRLITFKDDVSPRPATTDLATIQAQVGTLSASGGGDTPEASVEALWFAALTLAAEGTGGTVFLATDAPPHSGLSIPATISALRAGGARVNVILTESGFTKPGDVPATQQSSEAPGGQSPEVAGVPSTEDLLALIPDSSFTSSTDAYSDIATGTGGVFIALNKNDSTRIKAAVENLTAGSVFPAVVQALPRRAPQGATLDVKISGQGTNFDNTTALTFGGGIVVNNVTNLSPFELVANVTIPPTATVGPVNVTASTRDELAQGVAVFDVLTATSSPTLLSVAPATGARGQTIAVRISGINTNFSATSSISFGTGITVSNVVAIDAKTLTADLTIAPDATRSFRSLTVDGATTPMAFRVESSTLGSLASIDTITPNSITGGQTQDITITGDGTSFDASSTVIFSGGDLLVNSVTFVSATELKANVSADPNALAGFRDLVVSTGSTSAVGLQVFKVLEGPFAPIKQVATALIVGSPAGEANTGKLTITTTAKGGFSAKLVIDGARISLSGKFDANGDFTKVVKRRGKPDLTITLHQRGNVTGTLASNGFSATFRTQKVEKFGRGSSAPAAKYSTLIKANTTDLTLPQADGFGITTIAKGGAVRLALALADGTKIGAGTTLIVGNRFVIYIPLYKTGGVLAGVLSIADEAESDFKGSLSWIKPKIDGVPYPLGFNGRVQAIGASYEAPKKNARVLDLPDTSPNTDLTLRGGSANVNLLLPFTLSTRNSAEFGAAASKPTLKISRSSGLFSGTFLVTPDAKPTRFGGTLYQKSNFGSGFFLEKDVAGRALIND